jgi:nitrogenase molybdenum-iron protein alpha/beta subunit
MKFEQRHGTPYIICDLPIGPEATNGFLRRIVFELKNTSYRDRLSKHVKLPYKPAYFEGDTFKYIKD